MLDHEAIRKAYPDAVTIDDGTGAYDKDGKSVTLEQSKIDAARTELNTEAAKIKYKTDRTTDGSTVTLLLEINLICCMPICSLVN